MRHLLVAALMAGTSFGQDVRTPSRDADGRASVGNDSTPDPVSSQIVVEVRFLSASPEIFRQLNASDLIRRAPAQTEPALPSVPDAQLRAQGGIQLTSATRVVEEQQPVFVRRIDDQRVVKLLQAVQQDERVSMLMAPKVTLFNGQQAEIGDETQRPFVVALKKNGAKLEPEIGVVAEGTKVKVRAATTHDSVRLDLAIKLSEITNVETKGAGPRNAFVQVPRVAASNVALSALVEDGGTLVVSGLQRTVEVRKEKVVLGMFKNSSIGRATQDMIVLITPRVIVPVANVAPWRDSLSVAGARIGSADATGTR